MKKISNFMRKTLFSDFPWRCMHGEVISSEIIRYCEV